MGFAFWGIKVPTTEVAASKINTKMVRRTEAKKRQTT